MAYFPPSGSVVAFQSLPSSLLTGVSIVGQLPAGTRVIGSIATLQGTNPWITIGSISGTVDVSIIGMLPAGSQVIGSIATLQGTNPWAITPVGSIAVEWRSPSIVGTYGEDAGHTSADKGLFILGVRNDAIASFASANLEYTPHASDSAGRLVIKPFSPDESIFTFQTSVVSGSVTLIQASAIGKRSYITDFWFANTGASPTLITFQGGDTSIVGYTIVPNGGGSNSPGIAVPLKTNASQDLAFKAGTSTSILYVTVNGYQAP